MAVASKGYFAISKETTFGTAITTPTKFYPVEEVSFEWPNEMIKFPEIGGSRQRYRLLDGPFRPSAMIRGPLYPSGAMGHILQGLLGTYTSALDAGSAVAFKHTFADAATLPSFTLERSDARSGEGGILCERLAGAKVESVSLAAAYGEKVDMTANFQAAKKPVTGTAVSAGSITYPSMKPLYFKGATVEIDDVANNYFKNMDLEFTNALTREETLRGTDEAWEITEGGLECTLSGSVVFKDLTLYNRVITNQAAMKIELFLASDTVADTVPNPDTYYSLKFTWESARVSNHNVTFRAAESITADITFEIDYNTTNNRAVLIEMVNLDTSTTYTS